LTLFPLPRRPSIGRLQHSSRGEASVQAFQGLFRSLNPAQNDWSHVVSGTRAGGEAELGTERSADCTCHAPAEFTCFRVFAALCSGGRSGSNKTSSAASVWSMLRDVAPPHP